MKYTFRVECPKCQWGYKTSQQHVNQGIVKATCQHCGNHFFFKITVLGVKIDIYQDLPENIQIEDKKLG